MKTNIKIKSVILICLGITLTLSTLISTNLNINIGNSYVGADYSNDNDLDNEILKVSKISGRIYINNNWSEAKIAGICNGSGTYPDPYIIEDLIIDSGGPGTCIKIENSDIFFKIENCTVYNTGATLVVDGGIKLTNVTNGIITNNTCSTNYKGIYLEISDNNTISGNIINNNIDDGIYIWYSSDNTVSGNIINDNADDGVYLHDNCDNIKVSGNTMNDNGDDGIYIWLCNDNTITGNTINNNTDVGIYIRGSNNNQVSGNILLGNDICILEEDSQGNEFSDNGSCTYGVEAAAIPGYNLFFLVGSLFAIAIILRRQIKRLQR